MAGSPSGQVLPLLSPLLPPLLPPLLLLPLLPLLLPPLQLLLLSPLLLLLLLLPLLCSTARYPPSLVPALCLRLPPHFTLPCLPHVASIPHRTAHKCLSGQLDVVAAAGSHAMLYPCTTEEFMPTPTDQFKVTAFP